MVVLPRINIGMSCSDNIELREEVFSVRDSDDPERMAAQITSVVDKVADD